MCCNICENDYGIPYISERLKVMLNEESPGAEYPIKWIYDIETGNSSIENK
jgi:hypothetical protein